MTALMDFIGVIYGYETYFCTSQTKTDHASVAFKCNGSYPDSDKSKNIINCHGPFLSWQVLDYREKEFNSNNINFKVVNCPSLFPNFMKKIYIENCFG